MYTSQTSVQYRSQTYITKSSKTTVQQQTITAAATRSTIITIFFWKNELQYKKNEKVLVLTYLKNTVSRRAILFFQNKYKNYDTKKTVTVLI